VKRLFNVDYHVHTSFSDGESDYKQVLDKAKQRGLDCIAITDHFDKYDKNKRISSITEVELFNFFKEIKSYGEKIELRVLCGIETCTDFKGNLRLSDKVIEKCDIIITSPHYVEHNLELVPGDYYNGAYWERYKEKVINMAESEGDILGHAEVYLPYETLLAPNTTTYESRRALSRSIANKYFDEEYINELAKALKKLGKAYELHCITQTPRECVVKKLVENEVLLSLGSDAHALSAVGEVSWGADMIKKYDAQSLQFIK
jgi:HisJ family histidinol phosphate phosphatase